MYGLLYYRGDVTHLAVPGRVVGESTFQIPYEVVDSEYNPETDLTTVNLQHASASTMRNLMAAREALTAQVEQAYIAPTGTPMPNQRVVTGAGPFVPSRRQRRGRR